ncbi:hypothetical protein K493DRAFT_351315 [Basidiobolus meristosporus CBS 931.73]|uniref:Uncharacterized protein n=1 Tax=Basidiobolus meristosporus CBS 931.73 TaxID=1314790 RepID=A0A1Y1YCN7_9FUNG|nr:hypothetical protein K493DRAFT_351315 [Basidiobolus meristosporus CBS 931.73]|eukprot:ORX95758.1 hypothetical protein K493DRAFT_351315 [Basidiobolus meristosporus CBS 931.73]
MLSNTILRSQFRHSNASKNWRTALFLFSQLALSNTILGEELSKHTGGGDDSSVYLRKKNDGNSSILSVKEQEESEEDAEESLEKGAHGVTRVFQNSDSIRLIAPQPINVIEEVYLTEVPEEQIILFPDNQLRFLGGIQDWYEGGYGIGSLVEDFEYDNEVEIDERNAGKGLSFHKQDQSSGWDLSRLEEKLDRLIQEAAVGHKGITKERYNFGGGSNKELSVLSGKVEELIRTVGGISEQNKVIEEQTSKTYSISTKTFNEVGALNDKLQQLRRDVSELSDVQQQNTQEQRIAIVKSSKDVAEINTRLTELLRAVGQLGKEGSYKIDSGYTNSEKSDTAHDHELKEIRHNLSGLQSGLNLITREVSDVVSKVSKLSKEDNTSIVRLKEELDQVKQLLQGSIQQSRAAERKEIQLISEVRENQSINFKALSERIGQLVETLNTVAEGIRNDGSAKTEVNKRIFQDINGLGLRLNEVNSSLASLVQRETTLTSEQGSGGNHYLDGKNIQAIFSEFKLLRESINKIVSQQVGYVKETSSEKNESSGSTEIVDLLHRIEDKCEGLVDGQQKILEGHHSSGVPVEFLRDVKGMTRAIMTLKSVVQSLFKEQAALIKSKAPYGEEKWSAFNEKLIKFDKLLSPLSEHNSWLQQQYTLITKMDGKLDDLGKRINYLIEEQAKVFNYKDMKAGDDYPKDGNGKVASSLDRLRAIIQTLVESQQTLLKQYRTATIPKELTKDIGSINYRLADISNIVDRLIKEQRELIKRYGSGKDQHSTDESVTESINGLNSRVKQLVEVVELIAKQQKYLLDGKPVNIDAGSAKWNLGGLDSRLAKLRERVDLVLQQQESIFSRLSKEQSEEFSSLRGILDRLGKSIQSISKERRTYPKNDEGKYDRDVDRLEELTSKILQIIEKVAVDQQQILMNENGQSQDIKKINGKLSQLSDVIALVLKEQRRLSNGNYNGPSYSGDIKKLNEQLSVLREKTTQMIELQEKSLKNAENSSQGDLLKLGERLSNIQQAISSLYSGQGKLLEVVAKESTSQKVLENEEKLAERVDQLTALVKRLASDQIALLSVSNKGNTNMALGKFLNRLEKLDEIVRILNTQQSYTLKLVELAPIIQEEAADIKRINRQMGNLRKLLQELTSLEKENSITDKETLEYAKGTAQRLSKIYGDIEKMFNSQKEILRYLQSGTSIKGIEGIREMSKRIGLLTEATQTVLMEVKSALSQIGETTKNIASDTKQIDVKIERLATATLEVSKKQDSLLKLTVQLSRSQDRNFNIVNQRLNTLGKDINQLTAQQREILEKYGSDVEKLFGISGAKLSELRKSIELMINEQRKLVYHISENKGVGSKEIVAELSKLDDGMNQLTKYVRGLLDQQNKLLGFTQENSAMIRNHGKELRVFGDQMNKLYDMVTQVIGTQRHLVTREEIAALFKKQGGDIKNLSLELAEISNHIVQLLNQQKYLLGQGKGDSGELNILRDVLTKISESIRKVLVQQNILLQSGWDKAPKELLKDIEALHLQLKQLGQAVVQISKKQDHLIQQQDGDTKYIVKDIDEVKKGLSGLSQMVEKVAQFQLEILKRGGLTPEQAKNLEEIKAGLHVLDRKVESLVGQQQKLIAVFSKDGRIDYGKLGEIAQNLAELRKTIYELTSQQTNILSRNFNEALGKRIPAEIVRLNNKLIGLNKDVNQVQELQEKLFAQSKEDTGLIINSIDKLGARLGELGSYVKELHAEQKAILLHNTELLKQNLGKTDLLNEQVRRLDKKIETLVRIQFDLLKKVTGENGVDSKETRSILQGLSGLQNLIVQLIEQQRKLVSASLTGKLSESTLGKIEMLNDKYAQLIEIINQITTKQNALFQLSQDSNATGHHLEEEVSELNKRLLGLFEFIRRTFAEQTKVLNTREITALLKVQNQRIASLGVQLNELGNQFNRMVNEQGLIIKQLGEVSAEDTKRDRAIAQELGSLRDVVRHLVDSQKSLAGPEIASRVGKEIFKIIANLNDRMVQLGTTIRNVRDGQSLILKVLSEGGNYKQVERQLAQIRSQFAQVAEWVKRIAEEQNALLHKEEVMEILKVQTGDIQLIKQQLARFRDGIVRIVEIQNTLLRETQNGNEGSQARDTDVIKRLAELKELSEGIVNIQQIVLNSDIYKIIPKEILSQVHRINARLEKFEPAISVLVNRQESLLKLTSAEKRETTVIREGVSDVSHGIVELLKEVRQIREEQNIIISQNKEVKAALDQQLSYIQNINGRLANFAARTTEFLSKQSRLLERLLTLEDVDRKGLSEILNRVKQLQNVVASVLHWQQSLNLPEIIGSLPRALADIVRDLSGKIIRLTGDVGDLSQQQRAIAEKQDKEYSSVRQMLNILNERIGKFGNALQEIASVQTRLIHDDRVVALLSNQSKQIRGLGLDINTVRKEISLLINQQQKLLEQGYGIHQGEAANLEKIGGNIRYLTSVVDQLFKQQQLLANSQLVNQFPKRVVQDIEVLNGQVRGLTEAVREIRKLQAVLLNSQSKNNEITGDLAKNVQIISERFNQLSGSVRHILELQQAILHNEKVGPILEKFYGEFQRVDGRLSQMGELVGHILENQRTLVTTKEFQRFVRENNLDDRKIFGTLGDLHKMLQVLIEQQKDLVRPELLNAVARNLYEAIRAVGGRVSGLGDDMKRIQKEQNMILQSQGQLNVNFGKSVNGLNQQLQALHGLVRAIFEQQKNILRDEQVLKVIAERLRDLGPIKHNLSGVNERLDVLLRQQDAITQMVEKVYGVGTDISKQIIDGFNVFSRNVRQLISKQTTLLSETVVTKAPKALLGQIMSLNRQFDIMNSGIGRLFEIQKEILGHGHQEFPSKQILERLNLISQRSADLYDIAKYIAQKQDNLLNREELLAILRQQSGAIHGVDTRVEHLRKSVDSLISQQRSLLGAILQKLEKSGYSRAQIDAVLSRLVDLEKDEKIVDSTRFLTEKLTRLAQVVDRLFEEQRSLIAIEKENTEITKATFSGVEKLNNNLIHLDDAVQFLVKETRNIDAKVSTLLGLPQDMNQVKARLAHLSDATNRLIEQHALLFKSTSEGLGSLNQQQHVLSKDMNVKLSEIARLVSQLTRQQNQLLTVETQNSNKHSQEIAALGSKVLRIEEVVEFLLNEQRKLFTLSRNEQREQFAKLDQKLNLFGNALKQLINQQHAVMRLAGIVEKQSMAINKMGGALENLNGVIAKLVSQQQQLLVYTKQHDHAEFSEMNGRLGQLKEAVTNIISQHQTLLHREINQLRVETKQYDQEIITHFEQRINQLGSLMTHLVQEQDIILTHIKRQTLSNEKIVGAISRVSGFINDLAQLTRRLSTEQTSLIERGFTELSKQNDQGFKHMDDRLDQIGFALQRIAGTDANSLINRFELASRQQSRENREIKSRLNQITKVLEKIVTRPDLIFPNHSNDFKDLRQRVVHLDQIMVRLAEIQAEGTAKLLSLNEEQRTKVAFLLNVIPSLNESVRRLELLGATDSRRFAKELASIRESIIQCDKAILDLKGVFNQKEILVGSNMDGYEMYSGYRGKNTRTLQRRKSWNGQDSGDYFNGNSYSGHDSNWYGNTYGNSRSYNDLHDGYDYHDDYWYPGNDDFKRVINSSKKYSYDSDVNDLSDDIDDKLLTLDKYAPAKSAYANSDETDDNDSGY